MKILVSCIIFFSACSLNAQNNAEFIKEHAIPVYLWDSVSANYESLKPLLNYNIVLIGETHGTVEPSLLVQAIAKFYVKSGFKVAVGLEIPETQLSEFINNPSSESLQRSTFFSAENKYGRNGQACYDLILDSHKNDSTELFYFDNLEGMPVSARDSMMYVSILKARVKFPDYKFICLSGNIHNMIKPFRERETMGSYLWEDSIHFSNQKILSMNHMYSFGTTLNNHGNGLELDTINYSESVFTNATNFENYLILESEGRFGYNYNALFFTRKVSHSSVLENQ